MTISFRPAVRANVGLLIGLAGASGSGKTFTGMRLASGMTEPGKRFAVIDTENGRASHYADQFAFDVAELHAPFSPARYAEAIQAADDAGYGVIVVDSMSHEHAGEGGILDMQEAEFERLGNRDAAKMLSWAKPKSEHKRMMQKLLQVRAHLILCFRAEAKVDMVREDGKVKVVPKASLTGLDGWIPVCEKTVPFELTVSLLLTPDKPGIPHPIKLQNQHKSMFPLNAEINEDSGRRILEWARGGAAPAKPALPPPLLTADDADDPYISEREEVDLEAYCSEKHIPVNAVCNAASVGALGRIRRSKLKRAIEWVDKQVLAREDRLRTEAEQAAARG